MGKSRPEYLNRQELRDSEAQGRHVGVRCARQRKRRRGKHLISAQTSPKEMEGLCRSRVESVMHLGDENPSSLFPP